MKSIFISKLKPLLDAVAEQMDVYVPKKTGGHYTYIKYDPSAQTEVELNHIRPCVPVKEFLFPAREQAASLPVAFEPADIKPFAVFGLKECDLRSMKILDVVFTEKEFMDPFYVNRRQNMFIISSDCFEPEENCFCSLFEGRGFPDNGFDLNVSKIKDGFIVDVGSQKAENFVEKHSRLFADVPGALLAERNKTRARTQKQLEQNNAEFQLTSTVKKVVENNQDSDIFDLEAQNCVECQACTRVCPTCHCFYLYDTRQDDYFAKMKIWDSCMRLSYAAVAGGVNPNKILGDRTKHRLLHKFVYFPDRYGIDMCVGCGRCIETCAGGSDIRAMLKKLDKKPKGKKKSKAVK